MENIEDDFSKDVINGMLKTYTPSDLSKLFMKYFELKAKAEINHQEKIKHFKTYFILDKKTNLCKIGRSEKHKERLKQLNIGNYRLVFSLSMAFSRG